MMHFFTRSNYLLATLLTVFLLSGVHTAHAVTSGDLEVLFPSGTSLFGSNTAIAPGYVNTKQVTVINHSTNTQHLYTSVANEYSTGLADSLSLTIGASSTGTIYFNDLFTQFFSTVPVSLGTLAPGVSRTYQFAAVFASSSDDTYQNTGMGFDLIVGFEGGTSVSSGGGNSGGGGGNRTLTRSTATSTSSSTPPGEVAGISANALPQMYHQLRDQVVHSPMGRALGVSTTTSSSSGTSNNADSATSGGTSTIDSGTQARADGGDVCTVVWLLFLALVSLSWSVYHDLLQRKISAQSRTFLISILAHVVFLFALASSYLSGTMQLWYLLLAWWIGMVLLDSVLHYKIALAAFEPIRFRYYMIAGIGIVLLSLLFGIPCTWYPFAILAVLSAGFWWWSANNTTHAKQY